MEIFQRPIPASELLSKHPDHQICRSDSFTIGQKIPPLKEGELLKLGNSYFLLPLHLFQSVLSFVALASSFSSFKLLSTSAFVRQPFEVHKTASGKIQIRVSDEFIEKIQEVQKGRNGGDVYVGRVCSSSALERDYKQLVLNCRERKWKPKMETIMERKRDVRKQRRKEKEEEKKKKKKKNDFNVERGQKEKKPKKQKKEVADENGKVKEKKNDFNVEREQKVKKPKKQKKEVADENGKVKEKKKDFNVEREKKEKKPKKQRKEVPDENGKVKKKKRIIGRSKEEKT